VGAFLPKGLSPWWPVIGRNKKSVGRRPADATKAATSPRALIAKADVVIENFRPGTHGEMGHGIRGPGGKTNPGLIMARVSGFGQTGPYAKRAGYALVGEAMGGLRHITGEPDRRRPGRGSRSATACRPCTRCSG
jgi:formyl-CoA transferase